MTSLDKIYEKIDLFFLNKKQTEVTLIFFLIFLSVAFVTYSYLSPITEAKFKQTMFNYDDIEKKLISEKSYYNLVTRDGIDENYEINRQKAAIENAKIILEKTVVANDYVDEKLKQLSYLLFNNKDWANFLDSITQLAQKYSIQIKVIASKINEPSIQKIEQILNLNVQFNGDFYNTMKFINAIEESKLVVDIYEFNCSAGKKNLECTLNIAVWGMKY